MTLTAMKIPADRYYILRLYIYLSRGFFSEVSDTHRSFVVNEPPSYHRADTIK